MTVAIRKDGNGDYILFCEHPAFIDEWDKYYRVTDFTLHDVMQEMTDWANNKMNETLTFEVE